MRLIHGPLSGRLGGTLLTILKVDRLRLAKRRWRGFAEDGEEFGFDLEYPLRDGTFFFHSETRSYAIEQQTEPVIDRLSRKRLGLGPIGLGFRKPSFSHRNPSRKTQGLR